jgi:hypothetical protein
LIKNFNYFLAVAERWPAEERERSFHVPPNIKKERKHFSHFSFISALASRVSLPSTGTISSAMIAEV